MRLAERNAQICAAGGVRGGGLLSSVAKALMRGTCVRAIHSNGAYTQQQPVQQVFGEPPLLDQTVSFELMDYSARTYKHYENATDNFWASSSSDSRGACASADGAGGVRSDRARERRKKGAKRAASDVDAGMNAVLDTV